MSAHYAATDNAPLCHIIVTLYSPILPYMCPPLKMHVGCTLEGSDISKFQSTMRAAPVI